MKHIVGAVLGVLVTYLCWVFVEWEIPWDNIGEWDSIDRFFFLYSHVVGGGIGSALTLFKGAK